jgi:hypothetical protein
METKGTERILTGRFFREPLKVFLAALNVAAVESRKLTQTERAIKKVEYSLEHDFREGFAPREHKLDAYSLAGRELARLETANIEDLKIAKITQVRAQLKAAETLVAELQRILAELDNERGPTVFLERQREFREAREGRGKKRAVAV